MGDYVFSTYSGKMVRWCSRLPATYSHTPRETLAALDKYGRSLLMLCCILSPPYSQCPCRKKKSMKANTSLCTGIFSQRYNKALLLQLHIENGNAWECKYCSLIVPQLKAQSTLPTKIHIAETSN